MKVQIKILAGSRAGAQFVFSRPKITIGRHPSSDVQFEPKTDLDVSTRHAVLLSASGKWRVRDLQSRNGTFVNGNTISGDTRLDDTDQIKFGAHGPSIEFRLVPDSVPDSVSAPPTPAAQVEEAAATLDPVHQAPVAVGSVRGMSTTQRIRIEVAQQTKGFRAVLLVLFATLIVTITAFFFIDLSRKRARTAEIIAEQIRVDSILQASEQTVRALQGQMTGLTESLEDSRSEVSQLSRALTAANESGSDEQIALLRQRLNNASEALRNQQVAAQIDWNAVWGDHQQSVAMVWVEFAPGEVATGTAFAVTRDGLMLTNKHVVAGERGDRRAIRLAVKFADSYQVFPADVVAVSPEVDLAALRVRIPSGISTIAVLASAEQAAHPGQPVVAIGFPLGDELPMTTSEDRTVARTSLTAGTVSKALSDVVQLDAYGAQGSSGSPIFDREGRVIAILYGGQQDSGGRIVFAVPVSYARDLLNSI